MQGRVFRDFGVRCRRISCSEEFVLGNGKCEYQKAAEGRLLNRRRFMERAGSDTGVTIRVGSMAIRCLLLQRELEEAALRAGEIQFPLKFAIFQILWLISSHIKSVHLHLLCIIATMSAVKPPPYDYWMYRTHLWAIYNDFHVTDEQRVESILKGLERVGQSLIEDLAQESKMAPVERSGPSAPRLPQKSNTSIRNVEL
jgi:hypothetical protein